MLDLDITQDNRLSKNTKLFYLGLIEKYGQEGQCRVPYPVFAKEFGVTWGYFILGLQFGSGGLYQNFLFLRKKKVSPK
ncbi:MAG: hypothetical protein LBG90_04080 [Spirochaetaceae bacterium]|jgi:hypothetical protein|nr:hypothetical protein [Spirochaetaceae bacterium]